MPLTMKHAVTRLRRLAATASTTQAYDNAYWIMAIMYNKGQQWGFVNPVGPDMRVRYMRNLTDPQRTDVRVTMNKIGEFVRQIKAETNPSTFSAARYKPSSGSVKHRLLAGLGGKLMHQHLEDIRAVDVYCEMNNARMVLGSCAVRRTLVTRDQRMFKHIVGGDITHRPLREFSVGWARAYPWEFLRDPAAVSLRPDQDENIICHYKPRTVQWVKERFPQFDATKTQTTMGQLMTYNRQIRAASGMVGNSQTADSKEPGVMVFECYFKEGNKWPYVLFAFGDPFGDDRDINPMAFMSNPFYGLPFHFFHYDEPVQMPWGRGIPHILMAAQDITNLGWTWLLRTMHAGAGKWLIEKNAVERSQRQLNSRIDMAIEWTRPTPQSSEPKFIAGPQPSPAAMTAIGLTPEWMQAAINVSPVQSGTTSKRGESGSAIEKKLQAAGVPLEDIRRRDERELSRLLRYTLYDMTDKKWFRPDIAERLLGPDVPKDQVRLLAREGARKAVGSVVIPSTTLRPKTKADTREVFTDLVERGVIEAVNAQWEMWKQNDVIVNSAMAASAEKQLDEIARMVAGAEPEVETADRHEYHIRQLQDFIDSSQWHNVSQEARDRINDHYTEHKVRLIQLSQIDAMGVENAQGQGPPAQGSPPAQPAEMPQLIPGEPAGSPQLAVA